MATDVAEPFASKLRELLKAVSSPSHCLCLEGISVVCGEVVEIDCASLKVNLLQFVPGRGFQKDLGAGVPCQLHIPNLEARSINLCVGVTITCAGVLVHSSESKSLSFAPEAVIMYRPDHIEDTAWTAYHLFAGSFGGWEFAAKWLSKQDTSVLFSQHVAIDADPDVMFLWEVNHQAKALQAPLRPTQSWLQADDIGVAGSVADNTTLFACQAQTNVIGTMSPPCQPWSKGGRKTGLSSDNGWAFLSGLLFAFKAQFVILAAECADEITQHPHFEVLLFVARQLGFRLVWKQVTSLHQLSPQTRNRWLASWVRADVESKFIGAPITPNIHPRHSWQEEDFVFVIPPTWQRQLLLSNSEKRFYGDLDFLPAAKKKGLGPNPSQNQVLLARIPSDKEPMPTLCASYSQQHNLDRQHLATKGAFAALQITSGGFAFFDPARFVSMHGATDDCVLSAKIPEAFKSLGNAIAVPHALLPIIMGFIAVLPDHFDIHAMLRKCWTERLTASNSVVSQVGNHVHMTRISHAGSLLSRVEQASPLGDYRVIFDIPPQHHAHAIWCCPDMSIAKAIAHAFAGPKELLYHFVLVGSSQTLDLATSIREAASIQPMWTLAIQGVSIGTRTFQFGSTACETLVPSVSPTQMFSPVVAVAQAPFTSMIESLLDLGIWCLFEDLALHWTPYQWNFLLFIPDLGVSFATTVPVSQRGILCAAIQSLPITCTDFCGQIALSRDTLVLSVTPKHLTADDTFTAFLRTDAGACIWACKLHKHTDTTQVFLVDGARHQVQQRNHAEEGLHIQVIRHGDLLHLQPECTIKAGGHHLSQGPPPSMPAEATLVMRAEFATNTHGWMAADEMAFATQLLHWAADDGPHCSPPVYWDITQSEFDDSPFGAMRVWRGAVTHIPVLAADHWCALEVFHSDEQIQVVTVQVPNDLHARIAMILARYLDVAPHRLHILHHNSSWTPHLCGWDLVMRWAEEIGHVDTFAAGHTHNPMSANTRDMLDLVLQSSIEDWGNAGAPRALGQLAFRVRRSFFLSLIRKTHENGDIPNQRPLFTSFPPGTTRPPMSTMRNDEAEAQSIQDRICTRLLHIQLNPFWMHSDEMDFVLEGPRSLFPDVLFCPPATWTAQYERLSFIAAPNPQYEPYRHIFWFIADANHWIAAECFKTGPHAYLYMTTPHATVERYQPLVQQLRTSLGFNESSLVVHFIPQVNLPGLCGHQLLFNLYQRLGISIQPMSISQHTEIQLGPFSAPAAQIAQQAVQRWHQLRPLPTLMDFAIRARQWLLLRVTRNYIPDKYTAAGTQTPAPMEVSSSPRQAAAKAAPAPGGGKVDILVQNDPWLRKGPKPTQAKWEDLILQAPIPFLGTDGRPLQQVHRLQVSPTRAGVVLATKTHVGELLKHASTMDLAIIIPTTDGSKPASLYQEFAGPFEITLDDPLSKTAYKRLALLHVAAGKATYQLAAPKLKMTTSAVTEIVLEADSRLISKQDYEKLAEHPLQTIKQHLQQLIPSLDPQATFYGLRTNKHPGAPKGEQQYQCIVKAPLAARPQILEQSGQSILLARDFIDHNQMPQDTTVLPRFWPITPQELANMRIATKGIEGAAGIIATRRGLALRVWVKHLAAARAALLPTDQRLTDDNRHVVPRVTIQASGWPPGTDPPNVVKSTLDATGIAMVPTRTFRAAGVYTWIMTAEEVPKITRFTLEADGKVFEILLQHLPGQTNQPKGGSKGKGKGRKPLHQPSEDSTTWAPVQLVAPPKNKQDEERLTRLESRFDQLEQRQVGFESRVEDSLRQILAASSSRTRDATGDTPPPNFQSRPEALGRRLAMGWLASSWTFLLLVDFAFASSAFRGLVWMLCLLRPSPWLLAGFISRPSAHFSSLEVRSSPL